MLPQIICDFDGTIALDDVTDLLLERFALPEWRIIEDDWKAGLIGSRECMVRQVDLLRVPLEALDHCLDTVAIDPGFPAFVTLCEQTGVALRIVSDGLDYAIRRILGRFQLGHLPIFANRLALTEPGRYRLSFPNATDSCAKGSGTCKCRLATPDRVGDFRILIGDGASDYCAAASVDLVLAKDALLSHCRAQGLPHVAFADFTEAAHLLRQILRHGPGHLSFHPGAFA